MRAIGREFEFMNMAAAIANELYPKLFSINSQDLGRKTYR
jgi:hypothetical protein